MILYVWNFDVYEKQFYKTAVIDNTTSIIWVTRFNSAGEFELYIPANNDLLSLFKNENVIITRDDTDRIMIVEKVALNTDDENGDYLTITGRSIESIIGRRIVPNQTNLMGTVENGIRTLLTNNIISPSNSMRRMSFFTLGTLNDWTETFEKQITGKNLLESIADICVTYNYGFKLTFDENHQNLIFDLYKGVDRSFDQSTNTHVVFSPDFENLGNTEYTTDRTTFYNWVYVAGEGEGTARKIGQAASIIEPGLSVYEKWVDARNVSSNNGEISTTEYMQMLRQQANEEIELSKITQTFSGEILDFNAYTYGVDYNLGDKVSIKNEYGITGNATVTEITEVEDETGYRLVPTLSEWAVTA